MDLNPWRSPEAEDPPPLPRDPRVAVELLLRAVALLYDAVILDIWMVLGFFFLSGTGVFGPGGFPRPHPVIILMVAVLGFLWILVLPRVFSGTWNRGVTKFAHGLEITDLAGNPLTPAHARKRLVAKTLTILTGGVGFLPALFDPDGRTLHDRIAGTVVRWRSTGSFFFRTYPRGLRPIADQPPKPVDDASP
jgi:uncharacterized RDD family membrane protein YckC